MRLPIRFLFSAVSLLCVLALVWIELEGEKISPGPLAIVHQRVPELVGDGSCRSCHGALGQSLDEACSECHAAIAEQVAQGSGFHGTLTAPDDCGTCHEDHNGPDFFLAGGLAFELAGVADRSTYDHAALDFGLIGRHDDLECSACHVHADVDVLPAGQTRFLGLVQACASCHEDAHDGAMGADCASCHGQERPFEEPTEFEHPSGFPLTGGHSGLTCVACHEPGGPWAVESLLEGSPAATRRCLDCHESPHATEFLARFARMADLSPGGTCASCHESRHATFAEARGASAGPWHAASGFRLEAAHADVACQACHTGSSFGERFPGRSANTCRACHADPHGEQFDGAAGEVAACTDCHTTQRFQPATFDVARHAGTAFPLGGAHAQVACAACHDGRDPELECVRFRGLASSCATCHADPHGGQFSSGGDECSACHTDRSFRPTTFDVARHAETRFPLTGAHGAVGCFECHREPKGSLGCVRFRGTPLACASCHADPHAGTFENASRCGRCHESSSFSAVAAFDHDETGFALAGAHAALACAACHEHTGEPDVFGRTFGRAVAAHERGGAARCESCHADPHDGSFDGRVPATIGGRRGCARCHGEDSFRSLRIPFDHDAWTEFPLGMAHSAVRCESCHPRTEPRPNGRTFGLARAGSCASCHVDPHVGQFAHGGRTRCTSCHVDAPSFATVDFDHERDSRFPLDERHASLACSACHRPAALPDGRRAVRYKPLGVECVDCHFARTPRDGSPPPPPRRRSPEDWR